MRIPIDTVLLSVCPEWPEAPSGSDAAAWAGALLSVWRQCGMPVVHVGADRAGPVRAFVEGLEPQPNEAIFPAPGGNAFAGTGLEQRLEAGGHTTLVICGAPTDGAVAMTARHAGGLGFRVFVAADACWTVERTDPYGGTWPADTVHRVALAGLHDAHAAVVDARSACEAAALIASRRK